MLLFLYSLHLSGLQAKKENITQPPAQKTSTFYIQISESGFAKNKHIACPPPSPLLQRSCSPGSLKGRVTFWVCKGEARAVTQ